MERRNEQQIFNDLYQILQQMDDDISLSDDFFPESRLVADLGFESIDIVVFCTTIEGHFQQQFPFARFLAEVGQRDERDIRLEEIVELVCLHQQEESMSLPPERPVKSNSFPCFSGSEA